MIVHCHVQGDSIVIDLKEVRVKVGVHQAFKYCTCQTDCHTLELIL